MNTKEQLISKLTEANNSELKLNRVHCHVALFVASQVGKPVDGWFERRLKKHFAELGWDARLTHIAGMTNISISGGDSGYTLANEARLFLGWDSDMDLTKFEDRNVSSGSAEKEAISNRNSLLADDQWLNQAVMRIEVFQQATTALEGFMGQCGPGNEAFYVIKELSGLGGKQ